MPSLSQMPYSNGTFHLSFYCIFVFCAFVFSYSVHQTESNDISGNFNKTVKDKRNVFWCDDVMIFFTVSDEIYLQITGQTLTFNNVILYLFYLNLYKLHIISMQLTSYPIDNNNFHTFFKNWWEAVFKNFFKFHI